MPPDCRTYIPREAVRIRLWSSNVSVAPTQHPVFAQSITVLLSLIGWRRRVGLQYLQQLYTARSVLTWVMCLSTMFVEAALVLFFLSYLPVNYCCQRANAINCISCNILSIVCHAVINISICWLEQA